MCRFRSTALWLIGLMLLVQSGFSAVLPCSMCGNGAVGSPEVIRYLDTPEQLDCCGHLISGPRIAFKKASSASLASRSACHCEIHKVTRALQPGQLSLSWAPCVDSGLPRRLSLFIGPVIEEALSLLGTDSSPPRRSPRFPDFGRSPPLA